jgi:hypothetical protein
MRSSIVAMCDDGPAHLILTAGTFTWFRRHLRLFAVPFTRLDSGDTSARRFELGLRFSSQRVKK